MSYRAGTGRTLQRLTAGILLWATGMAHGQTTLSVTPGNISFTYQQGAALPAAKTVAVKTSAGTPSYTTAVSAGALWLSASPDSGHLPANVSVRINPTGLTVGTYSARVGFTAATVVAPGTTNVTLIVTAPPPVLTPSAGSLAFLAPPNPPAAQTVQLTTSGGPIAFSAAVSGASWLTVAPATGVVLPGGPVTLTVNVDPTSLSPQITPYLGKITLTATGVAAANKTQIIPVAIMVNYSQPTVASIWPAAGRVTGPATTVTIRGTNFSLATVAKIQGPPVAPLATTFYSPTVISVVIPASQLAAPATLHILANNPAPGGDSAGTVAFTVSNTPIVDAAVNAASYAPSIAPGTLMTLFGPGIGPVTPLSLADANADGFVDTSLGGVDVTVDGVAAPMVYISQDQITVEVPYAATVGLAKAIVVTNGAATANGTVDIATTAPGIFALDGSGSGQAAALNFTTATSLYSLNSSANAVKIGDMIILYLTGEGDYATSIATRTGLIMTLAALTPLLPMPLSPPPTVTIGGQTAAVNYAGPFVGGMLGVLQINAVVPAGSTTGQAVPVVVNIGGIDTQAGVTIATKP